jgi:hypothetical protein
MARQRLVKPDVFQHGDLYTAEAATKLPLRLAYIGLWTQADRRGCFFWKPATLKLNVLPFDNVDFSAVLSALESEGFVRSYVVNGKRYGWIPTLPDHQTFHIHEKPNPLIPDPPSTVPVPSEHSASTPVSVVSTGSSTAPITAAVVPAAAPDVANASIQLTTAANKAIAERFGEQTSPLLASGGKSHEFAEAIVAAGIPIDFAARSVVRQVGKIEKPLRSMAYFKPGVLDDWAKHNANLAMKDAPRVLPLERNRRPESVPTNRGSTPVAPEDADIKCPLCRTKETELQGNRFAPKHKPGCPTLAIGNGGKTA